MLGFVQVKFEYFTRFRVDALNVFEEMSWVPTCKFTLSITSIVFCAVVINCRLQ